MVFTQGDVFLCRQMLSLSDFNADDFERKNIKLPQKIATASPVRQASYLAGRQAARQALQMAGECGGFNIGSDAGGCPQFPPAVVGSISHVRTGECIEAVCLLARTTSARSLGVDLENIMSRDIAAAVFNQVCDASEKLLLKSNLNFTENVALSLIFSVKEALYKALWPEVRQVFDFTDVAVIAVHPLCQTHHYLYLPDQIQCGYCDITLKRTLAPGVTQGRCYRADWILTDKQVLTSVLVS
ncbi:4'-phosphopantetheinyl transferase superfamily protein [Thalassolituus sp. ST750PaO-4]|uniref:4'-phosphopantetheinyl transferase family protein n=1 Tax=Thalassolituus sp. ST750PaO-4 TaxID=2742965 RepID=UPI001CE3106D|nr:4'-phosphopantetheinyl transferase superfamily protein [Thalassolituus sp. ST750PaO-4]MCA6059379.1 4'-phosphopantetheinyl transferase superfamily protein [Thalassolituus sp. ST750PaO-4]